MVGRFRTLAWLVLATGLAACEPAGNVVAANTQADVLPATESTKDFGEYVLFFNALNTDQLSPAIASEYGIVRSKSRAMLNVSIHRKLDGGKTEAVTGAVSASAINLNGQLMTMTLREIREDTAIYYIGELAITDGEVLIYTVDATPSNEPSRFTVRFKKQFFVEEG
jgi:hypothetical protein